MPIEDASGRRRLTRRLVRGHALDEACEPELQDIDDEPFGPQAWNRIALLGFDMQSTTR